MPTMSNMEIDEIERSHEMCLPGLYRRLLVEVGYGRVGPNAELYHPARIRELFETFFDDPSRLFHPYFPFGCRDDTQEVWVIDAEMELAASIWHETVPDDWPDEQWLPYEEWVRKHFEPAAASDA